MRSSFKVSRTISVETVEGNDELLMAILVRLPPKSVLKFKCVSKRWNSILVDPFFHECYRKRPCSGRLLAFIQSRIYDVSKPDCLTILPIIQPNEYKIKQIPSDVCRFSHSSGGLILSSCIYYSAGDTSYFVINPLNKTFVELPTPNTLGFYVLGLSCDDNTQELGPCFRVVGILSWKKKTMVIKSYSSLTREWTLSKLVGTEDIHIKVGSKTFVCSGVFYWHGYEELDILVYDSNRDEKVFQLMKLPPDAKNDCLFLTMAPSDEVLWVGTSINENNTRGIIKFWKLPKDRHVSCKYPATITEDQWVLMHTIDNGSVCRDMLLLLESKKTNKSVNDTCQSKKRRNYVYDTVDKAICNLKLEALIPSDTVVAILSLRDKIFLYNLESKSLELVRYRGRPFGYTFRDGWHPLVEPVSLSTYAPFPNSYR